MSSNGAPVPRIEEIMAVAAAYHGLAMADMTSPCRKRRVARPRQIAMALARELTVHSLPKIGKQFGGRDHTTVLHAMKRVRELRGLDMKVASAEAGVRRALFEMIAPERGARPSPLKVAEHIRAIAAPAESIAAFCRLLPDTATRASARLAAAKCASRRLGLDNLPFDAPVRARMHMRLMDRA